MDITPRQKVLALVSLLLADAVFDAAADKWVKNDLSRLGFPIEHRYVFPIIKSAASTDLFAGLRWPSLGRLTAACLIAYFGLAVGIHARAKDSVAKWVPAIGMLAWSIRTLQDFSKGEGLVPAS